MLSKSSRLHSSARSQATSSPASGLGIKGLLQMCSSYPDYTRPLTATQTQTSSTSLAPGARALKLVFGPFLDRSRVLIDASGSAAACPLCASFSRYVLIVEKRDPTSDHHLMLQPASSHDVKSKRGNVGIQHINFSSSNRLAACR